MSCSACFTGGTHDFSEPQGRLETIHGVNTYITGDKKGSSQSVIIYFPDAFSMKLVNNKLLADRYAEGTGCKVLFPDVVPRGGAEPTVIPHMEDLMSKEASIFTKLVAFWHVLPTIFHFMIMSNAAKEYPNVLKYARAVKKDLSPNAKLGVAGFCWGGYMSTNLCAESATGEGTERLIDAQFCGHPSALKAPGQIIEAISKYKVPYSCAVASKDIEFTAEKARVSEAAVREKVGPPEEGRYEFKMYDAGHGFCVRAKPGSKEEMEGYEQATKQAVDWFNKYLK